MVGVPYAKYVGRGTTYYRWAERETFPTFTLALPPYFWYNQLGDKMRKHQMTNEAKVALKLATLIDSATLDLDRVGLELARLSPTTHYNRLILIAEAAVEEQGRIYDRANLDTLF